MLHVLALTAALGLGAVHRTLPATENHVIQSLTYADAAARAAATPGASDVGRVARQTDDGTMWLLVDDSPATWLAVGGGSSAYDLLFSFPAISSASQELAAVVLPRAVNIPDDCVGSRAVAHVLPTEARTFTVIKRTQAGVETTIGTVSISATTGVGTFTCADPVSLADTDSVVIDAPSVLDSAMAKVSITIAGTLP